MTDLAKIKRTLGLHTVAALFILLLGVILAASGFSMGQTTCEEIYDAETDSITYHCKYVKGPVCDPFSVQEIKSWSGVVHLTCPAADEYGAEAAVLMLSGIMLVAGGVVYFVVARTIGYRRIDRYREGLDESPA